MTEFKQIVGRGTRVHEDTNKLYFTLIDFRGVSNHFADPTFDGDPVQIYEPGPDQPITPPDPGPDDSGDADPTGEDESDDTKDLTPDPVTIGRPPSGGGTRKIYVDGVGATIIAERVSLARGDFRVPGESGYILTN